MAFEFKFPDVGEGIHEGELLKWLVREGEAVEEGQPLAEIQTDKAVVEVPSPKKGIILKLHFNPGDKVNVGDVLVTIGERGEKAVAIKPVKQKEERKSVSVMGQLEEATEEEGEMRIVQQPSKKVAPSVLAMPAVRKLAKELNIDLSTIKGTGPNGRVTKEDVKTAKPGISKKTEVASEQPKVMFDNYGSVLHIRLHGTRKAISEHMSESHKHAVLVTHMDEADVTKLSEIREKEKQVAEKNGVHLTYLPFIVKAVIAALKSNPYLNSSMDENSNEILLKKYFNIGFAVDTTDGLIVPVIKNADKKSIFDIAKEMNDLAEKSRNKEISLTDLKGGSFTITNIGSIGGTAFTPISNYPEAAILGVGKMMDKPVVKDGKIIVRKILPLVVSFDHRIIDGAKAAKFMNYIIKNLEDPGSLLS